MEGTQIQFWSADPSDPYSQSARAYWQVEGTLLIQGNTSEPVELFNSPNYPGYAVEVRQMGGGHVELEYARVMNPMIGGLSSYEDSFSAQSIDHCHFSQDTFESITRREDDGLLSTRTPVIRASHLGFSVFDSLGNWSNSLKVQVSDPVISSLFSRSALRVDLGSARDNVFLTGGGKWGWDAAMRAKVGYTCISCDAASGRQNNQFVNNAILNNWRNPDFRYWMRCYADAGREYTRYITDNYWSTTSDVLIDYVLEDTNDNFNLARIVYQPVLEPRRRRRPTPSSWTSFSPLPTNRA